MKTTCKVIYQKSYQRALWKNGLGHTDQIAIYPENADLRKGNFQWRISSARIEQASAFSVFPEHDRVLVIIKGEGVGLTHTFEPDAEDFVEVLPFTAYEFPGDVPSRCELIDGPVTDLSLFVRKGQVEAQVEVTDVTDVTHTPGGDQPFSWFPQGRTNFVFAAQGAVSIGPNEQGQVFELSEGDTFRCDLESSNVDFYLKVKAKTAAAKIITVSL